MNLVSNSALDKVFEQGVEMASDDWFFPFFMTALVGSVSLSLYLWFFRKIRSGAWIWVTYAVRATCGAFVFGAGVVAWDLLSAEVAVSAVIPFVGVFFLCGTFCMVPWGAFARVTVEKKLALTGDRASTPGEA
jgi:predicted membrane metal-binding protein